MRGAVGLHQPVTAEVRIVGLVAEVAAVGPELTPILCFLPQRLVDEVPDASADEAGMRLDDVPVVLQVPDAVSHGVGVLAKNERLLRVVLRVLDQPLDGHVHLAVHVGDVILPLIMDRARRVELPRRRRRRHEVAAASGLVAHRPEDHRGVVLVALHHARDTRHVRRLPLGAVAERLVQVIAHAVRLDVRFIDDVQAVAVAQVVPRGLVRIMRCAHRVDVVSFHQRDVLEHALARDRASLIRIELMPVHALDLDRDAVDEELVVPDSDGSEAESAAFGFEDLSLRVFQDQNNRVEIRDFRRPFPRIRHRHRHLDGDFPPGLHRFRAPAYQWILGGRLAVHVQQVHLDRVLSRRLVRVVAQPRRHVKRSVPAVLVQCTAHEKIPQVQGRRGI